MSKTIIKAYTDTAGPSIGVEDLTMSGDLTVGGIVQIEPNNAGKDTFNFGTQLVDQGRFRIKNDTTTEIQLMAGGDSYFNAGNFGIGLTTPGNKFSLHDTANTYMKISNNTSGASGANGALLGLEGLNMLLHNYEAGHLRFATNNTERMRINDLGRTGINYSPGTEIKDTFLTVVGGDGTVGSVAAGHFDQNQTALFMNNDTCIVQVLCDDAATKEAQLRLGKEADTFQGVVAYSIDNDALELRHKANTGLSINSSGGVEFLNGGSAVDHYEEFNSSTSSTSVISGGGSFSSGSPTIEIKMARIGRLVTGVARMSGTYTVSGNCNTVSTAANFIPASFQPTTTDFYVGSRQRYSGPAQKGADIELPGSRRFCFSFNSNGAISTCETNVDYRWTGFSYYVD